MEKLVYLLRKPADTPVLDFRKGLLDRQAPRLLEQGARSLTLNVGDLGAETGATVPISSPDPALAATASLWLDCLDDRGPLEATLREACQRIDSTAGCTTVASATGCKRSQSLSIPKVMNNSSEACRLHSAHEAFMERPHTI